MEKLEEGCQNFQALALSAGITRPKADLPLRAGADFAEVLMNCVDAEAVVQQLVKNPKGAKAFWHAMDVVVARTRSGWIRPALPPMKVTGPLAVLACTVVEYCDTVA